MPTLGRWQEERKVNRMVLSFKAPRKRLQIAFWLLMALLVGDLSSPEALWAQGGEENPYDQAPYSYAEEGSGSGSSQSGGNDTPSYDYSGSTSYDSYNGGGSTDSYGQTTNSQGKPAPTIPYSPQAGDYFDLQGSAPPSWRQFPVKIFIKYPDNFPASAKEQLRSAIRDWKQFIPLEITRSADRAHIFIDWKSELSDKRRFGETVVKGTQAGEGDATHLSKVEIRLVPPAKYGNLPERAFRAVVMHEMGHALGIRKNSDVEGDIMAEPDFSPKRSPQVMGQVVKVLAVKGIQAALKSQGIDISSMGSTTFKSNNDNAQANITVVDRVSQRDLNTLYRIYHPKAKADASKAPDSTSPPADDLEEKTP